MPGFLTHLLHWIAYHATDPQRRAIQEAEDRRHSERKRLRRDARVLTQELGRKRSERLRRDARRVLEARQ